MSFVFLSSRKIIYLHAGMWNLQIQAPQNDVSSCQTSDGFYGLHFFSIFGCPDGHFSPPHESNLGRIWMKFAPPSKLQTRRHFDPKMDQNLIFDGFTWFQPSSKNPKSTLRQFFFSACTCKIFFTIFKISFFKWSKNFVKFNKIGKFPFFRFCDLCVFLHAKLKNFFEKTKKFFWFFMQNCNDLCLSKKLNFILRISIKFYRICDWWQNVENLKFDFLQK